MGGRERDRERERERERKKGMKIDMEEWRLDSRVNIASLQKKSDAMIYSGKTCSRPPAERPQRMTMINRNVSLINVVICGPLCAVKCKVVHYSCAGAQTSWSWLLKITCPGTHLGKKLSRMLTDCVTIFIAFET